MILDQVIPHRVHRIDHLAFRRDAELRAQMHQLVAPSYEGTPAVLDYEMSICDWLYLLTDERGLVSFFLAGPTALEVENQKQAAVFMGLSATRQETKGKGRVRQLFSRFAEDIREQENLSGERFLLFATFATPSTLYAIQATLVDVSPSEDGSFREEYLSALPSIHQFLRTKADPNCPYRLPSHAKGTRYSEQERQRLADICTRKHFTLFQTLDVDETRGDRLILVARVPSTSYLDQAT